MHSTEIKKICFISNGYPTKDNPTYAFLRPVVMALADYGVECSVIAPQSFFKVLKNRKAARSVFWIDKSENGSEVSIYQPECFSVSNLKFRGYSISNFFRQRAIKKLLKTKLIDPDAFYGHFWECGIVAASVCGDKPVFVASGESNIWVRKRFPSKYIDSVLDKIKGVIAVSTKNLNESRDVGLLANNPATVVLPNAYDPASFFKKNKEECRKKIGIAPNDFIIAFVGKFNERKGVLRLVEAAKSIPRAKLILIGSGALKPDSQQIVFSGTVAHDDVVDYLNAADIFVLPTLAEGCCNAIVEAMACGLPVISSNREFNDDILDDECSIRINPESVDEIAEAIKTVYDNRELCDKMGVAAMGKVSSLTIEKRAKAILDFMTNGGKRSSL